MARGDPPSNEAEELNVTRPNPFSATVTWRLNWNQAKAKQKCLQSKYVEVGGKDCRLLVYPSGKPEARPCAACYRKALSRSRPSYFGQYSHCCVS